MKPFQIMTYNVWVCNKRMDLMPKPILESGADIIGLQEPRDEHLRILHEALPGCYLNYGFGREANLGGEYSSVIVNTARFTVLDTGTLWLTDTPHAFSVIPRSLCPRIFTWVRLHDNETGREFTHINTHLDHGPEEVRVEQAKILLDYAARIDGPVSITGDFNAEEKACPSYQAFVDAGYDDAKFLAPDTEDKQTWHGFKNANKVIDFCFVRRGDFDVRRYRVLDKQYDGTFPSDHNPVLVELALK